MVDIVFFLGDILILDYTFFVFLLCNQLRLIYLNFFNVIFYHLIFFLALSNASFRHLSQLLGTEIFYANRAFESFEGSNSVNCGSLLFFYVDSRLLLKDLRYHVVFSLNFLAFLTIYGTFRAVRFGWGLSERVTIYFHHDKRILCVDMKIVLRKSEGVRSLGLSGVGVCCVLDKQGGILALVLWAKVT